MRAYILSFLLMFILCYASPRADAAGPVSSYCRRVETKLKEKLQENPITTKEVIVVCKVDANGNITDVKLADVPVNKSVSEQDGKSAVAAVWQQVALGAPPAAPLKLSIALSNDPKKISVSSEDISFQPYMADLQRRIKRAWFPPKGQESKKIQVAFKLTDDGTMSNLKLEKTSGSPQADTAALAAVKNASPFRPLPDGSPADVDITFTFDYNVSNGAEWKIRLRENLQSNLKSGSQDSVPEGWALKGDSPERYEVGFDNATTHDGKPSVYLKSIADKNPGFGTVTQWFLADHYHDKRLQLSAWIKTEKVDDAAALWMRVDGSEGKVLTFDNMETRPIKGTNDWKKYSVVLDVPAEARKVSFGFLLYGTGKIWTSDVELHPVGPEVASTNIWKEGFAPLEPVNLQFTGKKQ